jgi:hypothetical protein
MCSSNTCFSYLARPTTTPFTTRSKSNGYRILYILYILYTLYPFLHLPHTLPSHTHLTLTPTHTHTYTPSTTLTNTHLPYHFIPSSLLLSPLTSSLSST